MYNDNYSHDDVQPKADKACVTSHLYEIAVGLLYNGRIVIQKFLTTAYAAAS